MTPRPVGRLIAGSALIGMAGLLGAGALAPDLASAVSPPTFKNCTAMHKHWPHGVAKPGATNKGGKVKGTPYYNAKAYAANSRMDRDHDGIACEA